jgi:hypothetical protein
VTGSRMRTGVLRWTRAAAAGPPLLRPALTGPVPDLPAAHVRHHPHHAPLLGRRPRLHPRRLVTRIPGAGHDMAGKSAEDQVVRRMIFSAAHPEVTFAVQRGTG